MRAPIAQLLDTVGRELSTAVELDAWAPTVQGAVGQVVGLRDGDGRSYVLKTYAPDRRRQAATEVRAIDLLTGVAGVPVPRVHLHGDLPGRKPGCYVLMERIPGVRWADRRAELDAPRSRTLHRGVGELLRRVHTLPHRWFGAVLDDGRRWPGAWESADARCDRLLRGYGEAGGAAEIARGVRRLVDRHRGPLATCSRSVLCHNDFIDSNLIVAGTGDPHLHGVVDLERASWDDPLADLARTKLHTRSHDRVASDVLVETYGLRDEGERGRVGMHEVLHAMEERTWITHDRPEGWQRSITALDAFLRERI